MHSAEAAAWYKWLFPDFTGFRRPLWEVGDERAECPKNNLYKMLKIACKIFWHLVKYTHGVLEENLSGLGTLTENPEIA